MYSIGLSVRTFNDWAGRGSSSPRTAGNRITSLPADTSESLLARLPITLPVKALAMLAERISLGLFLRRSSSGRDMLRQ